MKHIKSNRGFTLLELIIVLAIIILLIGVAVPKYIQIRQDAKQTAFDSTVRELEMAAHQFTIVYPNTAVIWAPFAGTEADPDIEITAQNLHDSWQIFLTKWPQDSTRAAGNTFVVEISENEEITITPDTYGGAE